MGALDLDREELPHDWRRTLALAALIGLGGTLGFLGYTAVRIIARVEARSVTQEVIDSNLEKYKQAAMEAASEAAAAAVRNSIAPLMDSIREIDRREWKHEGEDARAQQDTDRRLERLEGRNYR